MIEVLVPLACSTGGVVAAVYGNKYRIRTSRARKFEKDFHFYREALARMVKEEFDGTVAEALQMQIDIVSYSNQVLPGHQNSYGQTRMPLTRVMHTRDYIDQVEWIEPFLAMPEGLDPSMGWQLKDYVSGLTELSHSLAGAQIKAGGELPSLESVRRFVHEHAAHLLLNYRPSPREMKVLDLDATTKSTIRQKRLAGMLKAATKATNEYARTVSRNRNYDSVAEATAVATEVTAGTQVAKTLPAGSLPEVSLQVKHREALKPEEAWAVSVYEAKKRDLSANERHACQNLIQKMYSAVDLSVKAGSFSTEARQKTIELASQNRKVALAELEEVLNARDGLTAEEAEAIHSLRVDGKYLSSHKEETQNLKVVRNA